MKFFRGGVLEPEGTVEIKFKAKDLVASMGRLDPIIKEWNKELSTPEIAPDEEAKLKKKIFERQENLKPMYHQVRLLIFVKLFVL